MYTLYIAILLVLAVYCPIAEITKSNKVRRAGNAEGMEEMNGAEIW
jgi:hypothetical protein